MPTNEKSAGLGFLAGALGGAIGTAVLVAFQTGSLKGTDLLEDQVGKGHRYSREQKGLGKMFDEAHVKTAEVVADAVNIDLSHTQKRMAAPVTEFAFGILCAGIYGAVAEYVPQITVGFGSVYGAALFAGASEIVLPAIGFVPPPNKRTATQHAGGLAGNVVYGVVTEGIRRLLR